MFPYAAANVHQWHILEGLAGREDVCVEAVNAAFVATPREYKDGYIHGGSWEYKGVEVHEVGFLNLFGIRSIPAPSVFTGNGPLVEAANRGRKYRGALFDDHPFMLAGALAKRRCKGLKLCLYVPDLPGSFFTNRRQRENLPLFEGVWTAL